MKNISLQKAEGIINLNITTNLTLPILQFYIPELQCDSNDNTFMGNHTCRFLSAKEEIYYLCKNCDSRLNFDHTQFKSLLSEKFYLICDRDVLLTLAFTIQSIAIITAAPIQSFISDRYGRVIYNRIASVVSLILAILIYFNQSYIGYLLLKFFISFVFYGVWNNMIVTAFEVVGKQNNKPTINVIALSGIDSTVLITGVLAYILDTWHKLQLVHIGFLTIFMTLNSVALESYVFLAGKNRLEDAAHVMKKMARINRVGKSKLDFNLKPIVSEKYDATQENIFSVFKQGKAVNIMTVNVLSLMFISCSIYWGFTFNTAFLPVTLSVSLFLVAAVGLLSKIVLSLVTIRKNFKRKLALRIYLIGTVISMVLSLIFEGIARKRCEYGSITSIWTILALTSSYLGLFFAGLLLGFLSYYILELYPPQHKLPVQSMLYAACQLGSMAGPMIYLIKTYWVPGTIFVVLLSFSLPMTEFFVETSGSPLLMEPDEARRRSVVQLGHVMKSFQDVSKRRSLAASRYGIDSAKH